jgi:hypothetical protein
LQENPQINVYAFTRPHPSSKRRAKTSIRVGKEKGKEERINYLPFEAYFWTTLLLFNKGRGANNKHFWECLLLFCSRIGIGLKLRQ